MIAHVIRAFFDKPLLALALALGGGALGSLWLMDLPRDVFPDLSAPVFNVIVQNAGHGSRGARDGNRGPPRVGPGRAGRCADACARTRSSASPS